MIERDVKDMIHKTLVPAYNEVTTAMQQDVVQEVMGHIAQIKTEVSTWQSESVKATHVSRPPGGVLELYTELGPNAEPNPGDGPDHPQLDGPGQVFVVAGQPGQRKGVYA